jgi:hypothetical protein
MLTRYENYSRMWSETYDRIDYKLRNKIYGQIAGPITILVKDNLIDQRKEEGC